MEALLEKWFSKKVSLKRIEKYMMKLPMQKSKSLEAAVPSKLTVSCIQRQIRPVGSIERFIDILYSLVVQAVRDKSRLVVFPEYNFFDLFGLIPGFRLINGYLDRNTGRATGSRQDHSHTEGGNSFLFKIFRGIAVPVEKGLRKIISLMAEGFGIYIYTGSYILKEKEMLYNAGALYGPDGECIGTQKKIHLTGFEADIGLGRGTGIEVCTLPFGRVSFPVCMDATYFETFRIAREKGADIIILPIANMEEYSLWRSLRGIWPRVQESYVYGLKASLNGWIAGMHFTGRAGIFGPLAVTPEENGVVAVSPHFEGDYVVTGDIDIGRLYEERAVAQYHGDKNPEFEREYVKKVYGGSEG